MLSPSTSLARSPAERLRRGLPTGTRVRAALAIAALLAAPPSPALAQDFTIIVHPANAVGGLSEEQVSRLFLKKETRWPDGTPVLPVVLAEDRLLEAFCKRIHHKSASALRAYWYQMIFSGQDVPPPERRSAREVVDYVVTHPGAIGFVGSDAALAGVRTVILKK